MSKVIVTEMHYDIDIIDVTYRDAVPNDIYTFKGKKEWEEVEDIAGGDRRIRYWVSVARPINVESTMFDILNTKTAYERRVDILRRLKEEKKERIARYRAMVDNNEEICCTPEDEESCRKLMRYEQKTKIRARMLNKLKHILE